MMKLTSKATKVVVSAGLLAVMLAAFTPVAQAVPAVPPTPQPTQLELLAKTWRTPTPDGGAYLLTLWKNYTFAYTVFGSDGTSNVTYNGTYTYEGGKLTLTAYDGTLVYLTTVVRLVEKTPMLAQEADNSTTTWTPLGYGALGYGR